MQPELVPEDHVIQAELARAHGGHRDRADRQHQVVLPAFLDDEEAVMTVHRPGGDDHQRHETRRRNRGEQAGGQAQAGRNLGRRGHGRVESARLHADALEPSRGAGYSAAAEELVVAVRGQRHAQCQPQDQQSDVIGTHTCKLRSSRRSDDSRNSTVSDIPYRNIAGVLAFAGRAMAGPPGAHHDLLTRERGCTTTRIAQGNGAPENGHATMPSGPAVVLLDGNANRPRGVLGNKGHGIDAMRRHKLPVPPAFCITTEVGMRYLSDPGPTMDAIWNDVLDRMSWLEAETARTFGRGPRPLLVSVRSGAVQSMPGMMDTILDLGMNDAVESALAETGTSDFARDTRQRFDRMYRRIVGGGEAHPIPSDPYAQLRAGIEAVFASWNSPRALAYRAHHGLQKGLQNHDNGAGTAVVVQAMLFGNQNSNSRSLAMFSRNPITGANEPFGEWLPGGQGDDVVAG